MPVNSMNKPRSTECKQSIKPLVCIQTSYHTQSLLGNKLLGFFGQIWFFLLVESFSASVCSPTCPRLLLTNGKGYSSFQVDCFLFEQFVSPHQVLSGTSYF